MPITFTNTISKVGRWLLIGGKSRWKHWKQNWKKLFTGRRYKRKLSKCQKVNIKKITNAFRSCDYGTGVNTSKGKDRGCVSASCDAMYTWWNTAETYEMVWRRSPLESSLKSSPSGQEEDPLDPWHPPPHHGMQIQYRDLNPQPS